MVEKNKNKIISYLQLCGVTFNFPGGWAVSAPDLGRGLGLNSATGRVQLLTVWLFIAQSLLLSPLHHLNYDLINPCPAEPRYTLSLQTL